MRATGTRPMEVSLAPLFEVATNCTKLKFPVSQPVAG
jgi:hypothetical protein